MTVLSRPQRGAVYRRVMRKQSMAVRSIYIEWLRHLDWNVDHVNVTEVSKKGKKRQWNYYMTGAEILDSYRIYQINVVPEDFLPDIEVQCNGSAWFLQSKHDWQYRTVREMFYLWRKQTVHHISVTVEDAEMGEMKWRFRYSR